MSVMECNCGMVMSVAAGQPAARCIRCGNTELAVLDAQATHSKTHGNSGRVRHGRATNPISKFYRK